MTEVGRHPALDELLDAISAICSIEAETNALNNNSETFRVVLTFARAQCPQDWQDGLPKPTWFIDGIFEQLSAWQQQKAREAQWVSKEEQHSHSVDGLMAHWAEVLKKTAAVTPETLQTRFDKRTLSSTIVRLKELKERREAAGHSPTESRREKARRTWAEDEYEAPKREEAQRQQREKGRAYRDDIFNEELNKQYEKVFRKLFEDAMYGRGDPFRQPPPPKPNSTSKTPWHTILRVPISATAADIKKAYRKLASVYHPDRYTGSLSPKQVHEYMTEINTARDEGLKGL